MSDQPNPNGAVIDIDAAIKELLSRHKYGFSVTREGEIFPDREAVRINSMEDFAKLAREPKILRLELPGGTTIELQLRPLTATEQEEIDAMEIEKPMPPKKAPDPLQTQKPQPGQRATRNYAEDQIEQYDWKNREYIKKITAWERLKQAAIIARGLLDMEIPGDTLEKKADWLSKTFAPRYLTAIENAIRNITSEPIERASFISRAA
jgi:hypothetical protein